MGFIPLFLCQTNVKLYFTPQVFRISSAAGKNRWVVQKKTWQFLAANFSTRLSCSICSSVMVGYGSSRVSLGLQSSAILSSGQGSSTTITSNLPMGSVDACAAILPSSLLISRVLNSRRAADSRSEEEHTSELQSRQY